METFLDNIFLLFIFLDREMISFFLHKTVANIKLSYMLFFFSFIEHERGCDQGWRDHLLYALLQDSFLLFFLFLNERKK